MAIPMQLPLRPASFKETAMGSMISFAEILGAIFMSFAVALTLQCCADASDAGEKG
jgi:apolipoprotein N-acyltransferase